MTHFHSRSSPGLSPLSGHLGEGGGIPTARGPLRAGKHSGFLCLCVSMFVCVLFVLLSLIYCESCTPWQPGEI